MQRHLSANIYRCPPVSSSVSTSVYRPGDVRQYLHLYPPVSTVQGMSASICICIHQCLPSKGCRRFAGSVAPVDPPFAPPFGRQASELWRISVSGPISTKCILDLGLILTLSYVFLSTTPPRMCFMPRAVCRAIFSVHVCGVLIGVLAIERDVSASRCQAADRDRLPRRHQAAHVQQRHNVIIGSLSRIFPPPPPALPPPHHHHHHHTHAV